MRTYEKANKLKFQTKDSPEHVFNQIREKANAYFASTKAPRHGNFFLAFKFFSMAALIGLGYYGVLHATNFIVLLLSYMLFGFMFLIMGINFGHDGAHHCVTGNRRLDNFIFQMVFGLQGLSGYVWQIRHNFSHHIFPNVYENDTDLEISNLIRLSPTQKKLPIHKYQHIYAPFIYMTFSLAWIFFVDISMFSRSKHANLRLGKVPFSEVIKLITIKITYLFIFLYLPIHYSSLSLETVVLAYLLMNVVASVFLAFTFFISHHVMEADYAQAEVTNKMVPDSWVHHQIVTTIDFLPESPLANYIFAGFNLHTAHHIFPEVSHVHYPALTRIIKETMEENHLNWYKSYSFMDGVRSHFKKLKKNGQDQFEPVPHFATV